MSQEDLKTNRDVRKILVKHWLDLGRLSIRTAMGRLTIRGKLERIRGVQEDLAPAIVNDMFSRIKRIRNVARMTIDLENWTCEDGRWMPVDREKSFSGTSDVPHGGSSFAIGRGTEDKDKPEDEDNG